MNNDTLLEELELWKMIILPSEPKPEVIMDIGGFIDSTLVGTRIVKNSLFLLMKSFIKLKLPNMQNIHY